MVNQTTLATKCEKYKSISSNQMHVRHFGDKTGSWGKISLPLYLILFKMVQIRFLTNFMFLTQRAQLFTIHTVHGGRRHFDIAYGYRRIDTAYGASLQYYTTQWHNKKEDIVTLTLYLTEDTDCDSRWHIDTAYGAQRYINTAYGARQYIDTDYDSRLHIDTAYCTGRHINPPYGLNCTLKQTTVRAFTPTHYTLLD